MEAVLNGTKLYYAVEGRGPWLVLLHGLGASSEIWDEIAPRFAERFTVLRVDTRGAGRSERVAGAYSIDLFADDLLALLDQLGVQRASLLGVSMGGMIAQTVALKRPDLVEALVLVDSSPGFAEQAKAVLAERARAAREQGMAGAEPIQMKGAFSPAFLAANSPTIETYRRVFLANDPACFAATVEAILGFSSRERLGEIGQPTLIVCGELDPVTPPAASEALRAGIAGSRLETIPGGLHMAALEFPDRFAQVVLGFLAGPLVGT